MFTFLLSRNIAPPEIVTLAPVEQNVDDIADGIKQYNFLKK